MVDATKITANPIGHMIFTQAPAACDKNIFHLFRFTQPVKHYSNHCTLIRLPLKFFSGCCKISLGRQKKSLGIIIYCRLVLPTSPLVLLSACSRSCSSWSRMRPTAISEGTKSKSWSSEANISAMSDTALRYWSSLPAKKQQSQRHLFSHSCFNIWNK